MGRIPSIVFACATLALFAGCATAPRADIVKGHGPVPQVSNRWAGRTIVITGASSGLGKGTARRLASEGANVVLAARRTALIEELARECGPRALAVSTDVANPADVERLALAAVARFGRIDVWINNAGVGVLSRFEDAPLRDYSRMVDINLKGVIYGSHVALRQFRAQGFGSLVNIGSITGEVPLAYVAAYSATKAGILGLGRALNEELRLNGLSRTVKVATVMPAAVDTPWWPHAANYTGHAPRMTPMDDPAKVVDTIMRAAAHPKEEMPAGGNAQAAYIAHRILPDLTESIAADIAHREQFVKAPPTAPTSGTLHRPMLSGQEVEGGVRARMKLEDAQRRGR